MTKITVPQIKLENEGAKHFDSNKSRVDIIPGEVLLSIGDVFEFGAKKYNEPANEINWIKGLSWSKLIGSAMRHIAKFKANIDIDDESNLNHIDHAIVNLIMLKYMYTHRKDLDDRWENK